MIVHVVQPIVLNIQSKFFFEYFDRILFDKKKRFVPPSTKSVCGRRVIQSIHLRVHRKFVFFCFEDFFSN